MARLVKAATECEGGCGRRFAVVLLDCHGHPKGQFCKRCGDARHAELQAQEDRLYGPPPPEPPEWKEGRML